MAESFEEVEANLKELCIDMIAELLKLDEQAHKVTLNVEDSVFIEIDISYKQLQ